MGAFPLSVLVVVSCGVLAGAILLPPPPYEVRKVLFDLHSKILNLPLEGMGIIDYKFVDGRFKGAKLTEIHDYEKAVEAAIRYTENVKLNEIAKSTLLHSLIQLEGVVKYFYGVVLNTPPILAHNRPFNP